VKRQVFFKSVVFRVVVGLVVVSATMPFVGSVPAQEEASYATQEREPAAERKDLGPAGDIVIPNLNFSETELSNVIRSLANVSGLNILAGKDVEGTVSCYFQNVTVRDALESILATNGYGYIVTGNVVQVRPADELGEDQVETVTQVFILQYLDAEEVEQSLSSAFGGGGGASGGGGGGRQSKISANPGSNAIIVSDIPSRVSEIVRVLSRIDRRLKQVMIEARLVETSYDFSRQIGIDWAVYKTADPYDAVDVNLGNTVAPEGQNGLQPLQWMFGTTRGDYSIDAFLQLEEDNNDIRVLAAPRIMCLHNRTATVRIVDDLPYVESNVSQGVITQSVMYKETGITLEVTPRINEEGMVIMRVTPSQKIAGPRISLQDSEAFPVNERSAETELILGDGTTAVIGGLKSQDVQKVVRQVPFLGDIPLLGYLFKRHEDFLKETDLLLFITPHIVKDEIELTDEEMHSFEMFKNVNETVDRRQADIEKKEQDRREWWAEKERKEAEFEARR